MSAEMSALPGIDHPLILVRDIEAARGFYTRLGFTLTPVGKHPWGTSTSLAVMERCALELMGIYNESLIDAMDVGGFRFGHHMRDALAEREGISLIALHSKDAIADGEGFVARGVPSQGHIGFRRKVKPPGGEWDEAVVSLWVLLDPALPRVSHFLAQQHKPELLWVPEWMRHPNGAHHIAGVTYLADNPAPLIERLERMFGEGAATASGWEVRTGQGVFRIFTPEQWEMVYPGVPMPALKAGEPGGAAIDVAVADLAVARHVLATAGIATIETPSGPAIRDITAAGNIALRLVARQGP
jgi:catechol 2,3-dioxygenase-like lactoylglutathione lyase family enzyme